MIRSIALALNCRLRRNPVLPASFSTSTYPRAVRLWASLAAMVLLPCAAHADDTLRFAKQESSLTAYLGEHPLLTYVWQDDALPRPYFRDVFALDGERITRSYPPDPVRDKGNDDHADFHPGIWLAFGDLGDVDFWRLKGRVRHLGFETEPVVANGGGSFTVRNRYESLDDPPRVVAEEICRYTIHCDANPPYHGYYLTAKSYFTAPPGTAFGDQEEMGLGIRLDTPLAVRQGGSIQNDQGGQDEAGTWGSTAGWCVAEGHIGNKRVGALLSTGPDNFRAAWFHNRDYGLMVANPFGKKAMTGPDDPAVFPDSTPIPKEGLTLSFALYLFSEPASESSAFAKHHEASLEMLTRE